jgi:hypothetical protein
MQWTPQERAQVSEYYAQMGVRWMLDLSDYPKDMAKEIEADYDEHREDMSLGGRPFRYP